MAESGPLNCTVVNRRFTPPRFAEPWCNDCSLVLRLRVTYAVLRLAAVVAAAMTAHLTATDLPLLVGRLVTGSNASVQLTNVGSQPITAWSLATTSLSAGQTHRAIQTV